MSAAVCTSPQRVSIFRTGEPVSERWERCEFGDFPPCAQDGLTIRNYANWRRDDGRVLCWECMDSYLREVRSA